MSPRTSRRWLVSCILCGAAALLAIASWYFYKYRSRTEIDTPMSLVANSDQLKQTAIVPTIDAPVPEGKSAIWCASFQFAWNRLRQEVVKEPIQLANAQPIADRLNRADQVESDVDENSVYAAAGLLKDGIVERIQTDMAHRFPNVSRPLLDAPATGAVAYAYLAASSKYEYPFFENDERFVFTDSEGNKTAVGSFGLRAKDDYAYHRLRGQVQVLYCPREAVWSEKEIPEFVVDPCKTSQPYQIILARVDRQGSLAETLANVERKIASQPADDFTSKVGPRDTLLIPNMAWIVSHRFKELEGKDKQFLNPALQGLYLDTAFQMVQFRLNRSGAELASEAKVYVKPGASFFHFNRPFLVIMKKRSGKNPFLVVSIENAELLEKQ